MRRRIPLFFILCVGFLLGLSWAMGEYFDRGGRLNLGVLEPYYRPWLKEKGVQNAALYIEREKTGPRQWVVGAENLVFKGGHVKNLRLCLGFDNGQVKLKSIHLDYVDLDLGKLIQGPANQNNLLPLVLGILMNTPGSIDHVRLCGGGQDGAGWKKYLGTWDFVNQCRINSLRPGHEQSLAAVDFGSRDHDPALFAPMAIKWDQGGVTFWPATDTAIGSAGGSAIDTVTGSAIDAAAGSATGSSGGSAAGSAGGSAIDTAAGSAIDTAIDTAAGSAIGAIALSPARASATKVSVTKASQNQASVTRVSVKQRPQDVGTGIHKNIGVLAGSARPFLTLRLQGHDSGASLTGSFQPMLWRSNPYGVSGMVISGVIDAHWTMKNNALDDAFYTIKIHQSGSGNIIEPGHPIVKSASAQCAPAQDKVLAKNTAKDSGCGIKQLVLDIQGQKDQKLSLKYTAIIDRAGLSGAFHATKITETYQWSAGAKMMQGSIALGKMPHLWPKISKDMPERDWILDNFHGGSLTGATIDLKGVLDPSGGEKLSGVTVSGHLRIADMGLSFLPTMSRIQSMYMDSTFSNKGFQIAIHKGRFENHDLKGAVSITLDTKPVLLKFETHLSGSAEYLLPVLLSFGSSSGHSKALGLSHVTGVDQTQVSGTIPLIPNLSDADIDITLHSTIPSAGFVFSIGPRKLTAQKTAITIDYRNKKASINAIGLVEMVKTKWWWRDNLLHFSCQPDAKQLESLLLVPMQPYMQGTASIQGTYDNQVCHVALDLKHSQLAIPVIDWKKPLGTPLNLGVVKTDQKTELTAKGSGVSGLINAHHDSKAMARVIGEIHMGNIFGRYVFSGEKRASDFTDLLKGAQHSGRHQLFFRIPKMILSGLGHKESISEQKNRTPVSQNRGVHIDLDLACDQVDMSGVQMGHVRVKLSGQSVSFWPEDKDFLSNYTWNQGSFYSEHMAKNVKRPKKGFVMIGWDSVDKQSTKIDADVVDLGSVCNGLGLTQRIKGGDLHLEAIQEASGYTGNVVIKNIKTKVNALGKLLSIISPIMFTEMFSSGITFKEALMAFRYQSGVLKIINGIAKGFNLGLFLKGSVDTVSKNCDLQGVAVPSYLVNTFFSKIPIVGWLLGGSKGLISSEFMVTGPISNPKFKVIPFSLLKLGFLKNLSFFKESRRKNQNKEQKGGTNSPMVFKRPLAKSQKR